MDSSIFTGRLVNALWRWKGVGTEGQGRKYGVSGQRACVLQCAGACAMLTVCVLSGCARTGNLQVQGRDRRMPLLLCA
jgi:hypothetical protein